MQQASVMRCVTVDAPYEQQSTLSCSTVDRVLAGNAGVFIFVVVFVFILINIMQDIILNLFLYLLSSEKLICIINVILVMLLPFDILLANHILLFLYLIGVTIR